MGTSHSQEMIGLLNELALLKRLDSSEGESPDRQRRREEIAGQIKALGELPG
jgi:hypothetical protein